jgi:hypothetical protein
MIVLVIFVAGMLAEYFIMKNNPGLLTDVDAFVADIKDEKVLARLKEALLK